MFAVFAAAILLQPDNSLTPREVKSGWKLLFDGQTTRGWHNFKVDTIRPGWKVVDGTLAVADPNNAGDILTTDKFDWFDLQLDFKYEKGQNSGVLFHVADTGEETWHSGPEIQIYDHKFEPGVQSTGFLYELYDSKVDASKPAGQWNHYDIHISKKGCWVKLNGVKYYDFKLDSPDFWARVAKSKFHEWPEFAKTTKGTIALQGDHGVVAFKNIKIKPLKG